MQISRVNFFEFDLWDSRFSSSTFEHVKSVKYRSHSVAGSFDLAGFVFQLFIFVRFYSRSPSRLAGLFSVYARISVLCNFEHTFKGSFRNLSEGHSVKISVYTRPQNYY